MTKADKKRKRTTGTEAVQQVVFDYLEALLSEPKGEVEREEAEAGIGHSEPVNLEQSTTIEPEQEVEPEAVVVAASEAYDEEPEPEPELPKPVPSQPEAAELNCILVTMHGLNLAIPMSKVEGTVNINSVLLSLDSDHEWCLGCIETERSTTRVVDTAMRIIPERYQPQQLKYHELLVLEGRRWALACDEIVKSIRIAPNKVTWAGENTTRGWLLGTYMEERCAILNIPALVQQLDADL